MPRPSKFPSSSSVNATTRSIKDSAKDLIDRLHATTMMRTTGVVALVMSLVSCLHEGAAEYAAVMDLSYKPHVKAGKMCKAISESIASTRDRPPSAFDLDVSFSELGNDGITSIVDTLLNSTTQLSSEPLGLSLSSRMNRLTPQGVSAILKSMMEDDDAMSGKGEESIGSQPRLVLQSLDLGWNNLGPAQAGSKDFSSCLRKLIESDKCPLTIRLYRCGIGPAACRAIGKGLLNRPESAPPLTLDLCGNEAIGDSGTAALAAAIKSRSKHGFVLKRLDLSSCSVGDAGAEALALGIKGVQSLNLSNNKISDEGAAAIGQSLMESDCQYESIDLSNNHDIGDSGATDIAGALERGTVRSTTLRSSGVHADGAEAFGMTLVRLSKRTNDDSIILNIDLSGNPIGILRGKHKKAGGRYSASNLKSKASATTASYMSFIGKKIRSGMKEVGLDVGAVTNSVDSDDDEEDNVGDTQAKHPDASTARCGAKAFASAIVVNDHEDEEGPVVDECTIRCNLAVRHCFLDRGGADALAAAVLQAKQRLGVDLVVDADMNPVLEEDMIAALRGENPDVLEEMAERHLSVLETLRVAEERAMEAAAIAAARRAEEGEWQDEYGGMDFDRLAEDDDYDSDARYDDEYDEEGFY